VIQDQVKAGLTVFPSATIRNQFGMSQFNFKRMLEIEAFKTALTSIKTRAVASTEGWYFQVLS